MNQFTLEVTSANFEHEVLQSELPVLLDFGAEWCPPCKMLDPIVNELAQKYAGKVKVAKVDGDTATDLTEAYDIYGFPTLLIFKGGALVDRLVGFRPRQQIEASLAAHISETEGA